MAMVSVTADPIMQERGVKNATKDISITQFVKVNSGSTLKANNFGRLYFQRFEASKNFNVEIFCHPKFLMTEIFCNMEKYSKTFVCLNCVFFVFKTCIFLFTHFLYVRNCFITNLLVEFRVNYSRFFCSFVFIKNRIQ